MIIIIKPNRNSSPVENNVNKTSCKIIKATAEIHFHFIYSLFQKMILMYMVFRRGIRIMSKRESLLRGTKNSES